MNQPDAKGQWLVLKYVHTRTQKDWQCKAYIDYTDTIILLPKQANSFSFVTTLLSVCDRESGHFYLAYHTNKTQLQSHKWCGLIRETV